MALTNENTQQKSSGARSTAIRSPADIGPLRDQLREIYGRTAFSHKTHIIQAGMDQLMHSRLKTAEIALAAVTTTGLVIAMLGTGNWGMGVSTLASTLLLGLIFYTKDFDLGKVSEQHKNTSDALWHLREKYLDLLTDLQTEAASPDNIMRRRDTLREELNSVYSCALVTSTEAYAAAQKALQLNEDLTFSEIEIDMLLPIGLRKITVPDSE